MMWTIVFIVAAAAVVTIAYRAVNRSLKDDDFYTHGNRPNKWDKRLER